MAWDQKFGSEQPLDDVERSFAYLALDVRDERAMEAGFLMRPTKLTAQHQHQSWADWTDRTSKFSLPERMGRDAA